MSEDGRNNNKMIENIILFCLNHIILIKTKEGNIFGCYINRNEGIDKYSFIFSIDKS